MGLPEPYLAFATEVLSAIELVDPASRSRIDAQVKAVELFDLIDDMEELGLWMSDDTVANGPGTVYVRVKWRNGRRMKKATFQAIFAHELGHACSSPDEESACKAPSLDWAKETVADLYVYRWGLAGLITRSRKCGLSPSFRPGRRITDGGNTYRLSRNFDWLLEAEAPGSGRVEPCRRSNSG